MENHGAILPVKWKICHLQKKGEKQNLFMTISVCASFPVASFLSDHLLIISFALFIFNIWEDQTEHQTGKLEQGQTKAAIQMRK